ncbi:MAG: hypothetical protein WAT43_15680, partial [Chitinophagales bacterium]
YTSPDRNGNKLMYQCNNVPMYQWNSRIGVLIKMWCLLECRAGKEVQSERDVDASKYYNLVETKVHFCGEVVQ